MTGLDTGSHIGESPTIGHNQTKVGRWIEELSDLLDLCKLRQIRAESHEGFVKSVLLELRGFLESRVTNMNLDVSGEYHNAIRFLGHIKTFNALSFLSEIGISPIDISKMQVVKQIEKIKALVDDVIVGDDIKVGGTSID